MSWFNGARLFMIKPLVHVLAALTIWAFVLYLLLKEKNEFITSKLDLVKTYQVQKVPKDYDYTDIQITGQIKALWATAGVCMGSYASWNGDSTCNTKRQAIVTAYRAAMGCDKYRSQSCNCINQVLRNIADDVQNGIIPSGSFTTISADNPKHNWVGKQDAFFNTIDACHYLYHSSYFAGESNDSVIRRSYVLFFLSTVVTGSLFFQFVVLPFTKRDWLNGWAAPLRLIGLIAFPVVGAGVTVGLESGTMGLVTSVLIVPFIGILLWYEFFLPRMRHEPFIHPFFFAVIQALLSVLALVENGVVDQDVITIEIWKQHLISFLYYGVTWFYLFAGIQSEATRSHYSKKPAQVCFLGYLLIV